MIYLNGIYPEGKLDSQGNYKYWFDIISPRIDSEVKNIDFDTKDILIYSDKAKDSTPLFLTNARLKEWLRNTGQASEINDSVEDGVAWGNVVWKKIKGGYETLDLKNTYIVNQTARTLKETPVVERHQMTQSDLRAKAGVWKNVEEVIEECGKKESAPQRDQSGQHAEPKETPYYDIYERNGEVSEKDLREARGEKGGDEKKYILAKIVTAGLTPGSEKKSDKYILYADKISKMPYKEYHRGRYTGRWMRKGICEILFDIQTRCNEIGNQIARGLEYASKTIFKSGDRLIAQNILTDMLNGDIIRSKDLSQVQTRMEGFDQLAAEWNRLIVQARELCNSYEVVQGETMPARTPFRLGALINLNANKLFDFIREKLGLVFQEIVKEWILPDLLADLKGKTILRLMGDADFMNRYYQAVAKSWYIKNLLSIGPHTKMEADLLIQQKAKELSERPQSLIKYSKDMFKDFKPRARVIITGENIRMMQQTESLANFARLEADPIRRTALIEKAMKLQGIDVAGLPKSTPEQIGGKGLALTAPGPAPEPSPA